MVWPASQVNSPSTGRWWMYVASVPRTRPSIVPTNGSGARAALAHEERDRDFVVLAEIVVAVVDAADGAERAAGQHGGDAEAGGVDEALRGGGGHEVEGDGGRGVAHFDGEADLAALDVVGSGWRCGGHVRVDDSTVWSSPRPSATPLRRRRGHRELRCADGAHGRAPLPLSSASTAGVTVVNRASMAHCGSVHWLWGGLGVPLQ